MALRQTKEGHGWEITCQKCHKSIAGPYPTKKIAEKQCREGYDYFCVLCASMERIEEQGLICDA